MIYRDNHNKEKCATQFLNIITAVVLYILTNLPNCVNRLLAGFVYIYSSVRFENMSDGQNNILNKLK